MKIIINESSLVHLVSTFLDKIDHPEGICSVGTQLGKIRQYYTDKVSSYFGIPVHVSFELVSC